MGLAQYINFNYNSDELGKLLSSLGYEKLANSYFMKTANCSIEIKPNALGLHIHRSGDYFYYFGLLIEKLGEITESLIITDK